MNGARVDHDHSVLPAPMIDLCIVGAEKAGTTSLGRYLSTHQRILTHIQTEFSYFTEPDAYERSYVRAFRSAFPRRARSAEGRLLLVKSAGLMADESAIRRLREHNANAKLMVMLRDPVARAYSAYWYQVRVGRERSDYTFADALSAEHQRLNSDPTGNRHFGYRSRGEYARHLRTLFRYFPRSSVHVGVLEDVLSAPELHLREFDAFCGVPSHPSSRFEPANEWSGTRSPGLNRLLNKSSVRRISSRIPSQLRRYVRGGIARANSVDRSRPPVSSDIASSLSRHFEPWTRDLEDLIDRPLDRWMRPGMNGSTIE